MAPAQPIARPARRRAVALAVAALVLVAGGWFGYRALFGARPTAWVKASAALREAPSASAPVLATLPVDAEVALYGCEAGWCEVKAEARGHLEESALSKEPPQKYVWSDAPVLRRDPDYAAPVLKLIPPAETVALLAAGDRFSKVRSGEMVGYVPRGWLESAPATAAAIAPRLKQTDDPDERVRLATAAVNGDSDNPESHRLLVNVLEPLDRPVELEAARQALSLAEQAAEVRLLESQLGSAATGLVLDPVTARGAPSVQGEVLKTLMVADGVKVLDEVRKGPGAPGWQKIALGEKAAWVPVGTVVVPAREAPSVRTVETTRRRKKVARQVGALTPAGAQLASLELRTSALRYSEVPRRAELAALLVEFVGTSAAAAVEQPRRISPRELCEVWADFSEDPEDRVRESANEALLRVAARSRAAFKASRCTGSLDEAIRMLPARGTAREYQQLGKLAAHAGGTSRSARKILQAGPRP